MSLAGLGALADGLDETESAAVHAAADFAREKTCDAVTGHDWWHVVRVTRVALMLADVERADRFVVNLAALLHDVDDHKVSGSFETGAQTVRRFLDELGVSERNAAEIAGVVAATSFRGAGVAELPTSVEGWCVRDADRLDALGAIGIARAFAWGGRAGRPLHDPSTTAAQHDSAEQYARHDGTSVNHFHEKLLLLHGRMGTAGGRRIAAERTRILREFLTAFGEEWDSRDVAAVLSLDGGSQ